MDNLSRVLGRISPPAAEPEIEPADPAGMIAFSRCGPITPDGRSEVIIENACSNQDCTTWKQATEFNYSPFS